MLIDKLGTIRGNDQKRDSETENSNKIWVIFGNSSIYRITRTSLDHYPFSGRCSYHPGEPEKPPESIQTKMKTIND